MSAQRILTRNIIEVEIEVEVELVFLKQLNIGCWSTRTWLHF